MDSFLPLEILVLFDLLDPKLEVLNGTAFSPKKAISSRFLQQVWAQVHWLNYTIETENIDKIAEILYCLFEVQVI